MKVAFIAAFDLDRLSGTPIRARAVARALRKKNNESNLKVITAGSLDDRDIVVNRRDKGISFPYFIFLGLKHLIKFSPDIIHAISPISVILALIYKSFHWKTKVVYEHHGLIFFEFKNRGFFKRYFFSFLDTVGLYFSDKIIAMSHSQESYLVSKLKIKKDKIDVIWGPVNLDFFPLSDLPSGDFVVGYIGNDLWWQGLETIKEVAKSLEKSFPNIRFLLAGFDPSKNDHEDIKNVDYLGKISRSEIGNFFAQCHVLLSTRIGSGVSDLQYPQKLSEYLAAGRPIIATDVSDQRIVVEKSGAGVIIPADDSSALKEAIISLLEMDDKNVRGMGEKGRRFAEEKLSVVSLSLRLRRLYKDISKSK